MENYEFERGALMKRTFGRFMSLLLVLAMVLAMVPAALAAYETYSVEPGAQITVSTTTAGFAPTKWESNTPSVATVTNTPGTSTTVTGVTASSSPVTITATGTLTTAGQSRDYSETFTVYVQDAYNLQLAINSGSVGQINSINQGEQRTLTATVTLGNSAQISNLANAKVRFTSDTGCITVKSKDVDLEPIKSGSYVTGYRAITTVEAAVAGSARVTARVIYQDKNKNLVESSSVNAIKTVDFKVAGKASIKVALPDAQKNLTLDANGTASTITPTVTGHSGTQPRLMYIYDNANAQTMPFYVRVNNTTASASVEPLRACESQKIYICLEQYNKDLKFSDISASNPGAKIQGEYAVCTVNIRNAGMSVTKLEVIANSQVQKDLNEGNKVFGVQDEKEYGSKKITSGQILPTLDLTARIKAPDTLLASQNDRERAYGRIEWTSSAPTIAKVTNTTSDKDKAVATITAVAPGTATITAKVDGNVTATYAVTVYQGRVYWIKEEPSIGEMVGKMTVSELKSLFEKESAKVEAQTGYYADETAIYELPVKSATVNGSETAGYTFTYSLNGIKTATKEFFYNKDKPTNAGFTTTKPVKFSNITFTEQPANASYKLTDTIANLNMTASVSSGTISSVVWYLVSDQSNDSDRAIYTDTASKTSPMRSTLSNLKQYLSGTGTYVFYCRVTTTDGQYADTRKAIINVTGENHINIVFNPTTAKAGDTFTITGTPQDYVNGTLTNVTGKTYTVTWSSSDESIVRLSSKSSTNSSPSVTATAKAGGTVTIKAETTIGAKKYAAEKTFTVTTPTAETVSLTLGENDTYVLLDGSKLATAVKNAAKTTPSTFTFESPANGTLYTSSSLSSTASTSTKYSASEVSKMAYRPAKTTGTHTIKYAAYDGSAQIATGTINIMTSASTVEYHITANASQQMVVSDFQAVYGSGLSSVTFSSNSDTRGALYKGSTTSSGKVGSEAYSVSSGTSLLRNVYFIAGSTATKYTVTIPFTATGSAGTVNGQLVVYVNDTHTLNSTGASFRSMDISSEITPDNATGSTYVTIDRIVGGQLYSSYTSIKSCTALTSRDLGSTKFYLTGSNSVDSLYVLPLADSKSVEISYTIDGSTKGTLSFKVNQQTASNQFTDVSGSYKWAANSVDFMFMNDIIKGNNTKNPKLFGPGAKMTRAMLVTVLYRAAGEPTVAGITNKFTDNKQGQYYYNAVLWASNMGIVNGATATTFDPNGNITREQIAAILYRYAGSPAVTGSLSGYSDQAQVSSFAVKAMQWAVGSGIITGVTSGGKTTLSAKGNATRAQVAVMLHRFLTFE